MLLPVGWMMELKKTKSKSMKKILLIGLVVSSHALFAQKLTSTNSITTFFSSATLEDIAATTKKGKSVIDTSNGNIAFSIPISSFEFEKLLMQEHFNEKYMETEKFPKASFSGLIEKWNGESLEVATTKGKLNIHGVTKEIIVNGNVIFEENRLILTAKFNVRLEDFGVEVPSLMFQKIAEVVEITINYEYPTDEN